MEMEAQKQILNTHPVPLQQLPKQRKELGKNGKS